MSFNFTAIKANLERRERQKKLEQQKQINKSQNEQEEQKQQPREEVNQKQLIIEAKKEKERKNNIYSKQDKIQDFMEVIQNSSSNKEMQKLQRELDSVKKENNKQKLLLFEIKLQNIINKRKRQFLRIFKKNANPPSPKGFLEKTKYFFTGKALRSLSRDASYENNKFQQDEIKNKQDQITQLKAQISDKEALIKTQQKNLMKIENEKFLKEQLSARDKKQIKQYEENYDEVIRERNQLQKELAELEQLIKHERGQLINQRRYFENQIKIEQDKKEEINKNNERLAARVKRFNDDQDQQKRIHDQKQLENEQIINQLSNHLQDREVRINTLTKEIAQLNKDLKQSKMETQQREQIVIENQNDGRVAQLNDQIAQLTKQVNQQQSSEQRITDLTNQIAQLQNNINEKDRIINERQGIADLDRDNQNLRQQLDQSNQTVQNLQIDYQKKHRVIQSFNELIREPFLNDFVDLLSRNNIDISNSSDLEIRKLFKKYTDFLSQNRYRYEALHNQILVQIHENEQQQDPNYMYLFQHIEYPPEEAQQQPHNVQQQPPPQIVQQKPSQIVQQKPPQVIQQNDIQATVQKICKHINSTSDKYYPDILLGHLREFPNDQTIQNLIQRLEQLGNRAIGYAQLNKLSKYQEIITELREHIQSQGYSHKKR